MADPLPKCHLCGTDIAIGAPRAAIGNSRDWAHYECFYPKPWNVDLGSGSVPYNGAPKPGELNKQSLANGIKGLVEDSQPFHLTTGAHEPNVSGDPGSTANTTLPGGALRLLKEAQDGDPGQQFLGADWHAKVTQLLAQPPSERIKLARNIMLALYDGQTDQAAMMLLALLDA